MPDTLGLFREALGLHRAGRYADAEKILRDLLRAHPAHADAWNLLGATLATSRRYAEAEPAYRRALAIEQDHEGALNNLAVLLRQTGRPREARETYLETLRHYPRHANAWNNLGVLYAGQNDYGEAARCYLKVLEAEPDYEYALGAAANAQAMICDWSNREVLCRQLADGVAAGRPVVTPFILLSQLDDPMMQLSCARHWSRQPAVAATLPVGRYHHDRIRVAYLSADLREHPVGLQLAELVERHDRRRFEWFGVYHGPQAVGDATHRRFRVAFDSFLDVGMLSDAESARRLRALEIDILVDLGSHTLDSRPGIAALRPAPVQVGYLGYPGTTGAPWIDYLLADDFVVPPESRGAYSERVVYLPDTFWVSESHLAVADPAPHRAELGLPEQGFVFCCFNHTYKLNPQMFDVWMRLLRGTEGSVLWLLKANPEVEERLGAEARSRGVDPARLVFAPRIALSAHLARHACADLFLDTLPFNAITTASVALHAGLPVLTCAGRSFAARGAGSLLRAVGLTELITSSLDAYEAKAIALTSRPERLVALREVLADRRRAGPLFDPERFRRHVEAAYRTLWLRWQRGEAPADLVVHPAAPAAR
jgi:protein O-GlcNAc transferase